MRVLGQRETAEEKEGVGVISRKGRVRDEPRQRWTWAENVVRRFVLSRRRHRKKPKHL